MAYQIQQYRYFGNANSIQNITKLALCNETVSPFKNYNIIKLGIQSIPGIKFYINSSSNPIMINGSGIYEVDLQNTDMRITELWFDNETLESLIPGTTSSYLIIDIIYEDGTVTT